MVAFACATVLATTGLTACGSDGAAGDSGEGDSAAERSAEKKSNEELEKAADQSTCLADAKAAATPYADDFPDDFVFPPQTTVFSVEDRGDTGVIVTAVSATPFSDILDFLNDDEVAAGFAITSGETEEHDAEANWKSDVQTGRWAIRESASCAGETVIQALAIPAS